MQEENRRPRRRYPVRPQRQTGAQDGTQEDQSGASGSGSANGLSAEIEAPVHDVFLDESELFSQLCTVTNLVKVGPKPGLFLSHVNVGDGLIRVWRQWLSVQAARCVAGAETTGAGAGSDSADREHILWADAAKQVGLRFRVCEKSDGPRPVLALSDEDLPVSYTLEYEELLVRTTQLLLSVEKSNVQEVTSSGKAVVIASI